MDTRSPTATDTRVNITARMSDSSSSDDDDLGVSDKADDTFYPPAKYMKKIRKLENKVKKLSQPQPEVARIKRSKQNTTGPKQSQSNNVTGDQDLYIGGVPSNISNTDDMKAYLKSRGIHKASHITQLSRTSEWLSFKVTLPRHSYHYALNHNGWTTGIRIRLFRESGGSGKPHQQLTGCEAQYRGRESQFRGRESEFRASESQFRGRETQYHKRESLYKGLNSARTLPSHRFKHIQNEWPVSGEQPGTRYHYNREQRQQDFYDYRYRY